MRVFERFLRRASACTLRTLTALALVLLALPAAAQYNYFPGTEATDDGRFVALAGDNVETLAQDSLTFLLAVPPGVDQFELGIFDGETGGVAGNGQRHWDSGSTQLQYALYYDPYQLGSTDPGDLLAVWRGNETNPTSGSGWTSSDATFPDNGWWNVAVDVPEPPEPLPGQAPSGATFYHLCVSYRAQTGGEVVDPCTGDARPADTASSTIANFKLRATTNISVLSFAFAYEGAMRPSGNEDIFIIYPEYTGGTVASDFFITTPTTYDGNWRFFLDVPTSQDNMVLFGGDFDFGTAQVVGFPSGAVIAPCVDDDDPDTSNDPTFPPFAVNPDLSRNDDSLPEGARLTGGFPPDDNRFDAYRRSPCVNWHLTSPGTDGDLATTGDNVVYVNSNPSSQREWEQFRISSEPTCDSSDLCLPSVGNCADYCEANPLPAGTWQVDINGVDLSNLNAWRSDNLTGFCVNCGNDMPRPYLVGDTVFDDVDGDGEQDAGETGLSGVLVELLDSNGQVLATRLTGDGGSGYGAGEWQACQDVNTGTGTTIDTQGLYCFDVSVRNWNPQGVDSVDYTVRIAASNFQPGGALYEYFGAEPDATRPSPSQTNTVTEGGDNVLSYDFGYSYTDPECGACEGKVTRLTLRYNGDAAAYVKIKAKKGGDSEYVFAGTLQPGEIFEIVGSNSGSGGFSGTLGTEIQFKVDGEWKYELHTSCSVEVGPGTVVGDFEVLAGASKDGGNLCPVDGCTDCGGGGECTTADLDFESDRHGQSVHKGTYVDDEFDGVWITTHDPRRYPAMIFDSSHPTGGDWDLGTANQSFGGPGRGNGGKSGNYANRSGEGNVLIVSEDGHWWDPDDRASGGWLIFVFHQPVHVSSVGILDVENRHSKIYAYDADWHRVADVSIPDTGDNGRATVGVDADSVKYLKVYFKESGAVTRVSFCDAEEVDGGGGGSQVGTGTIGYWKNHASAWPVDSVSVGPHELQKSFAVDFLGNPSWGDVTLILAKQLIATKLNLANGTEASCIEEVVEQADEFIEDHPPFSWLSSSERAAGEALKDELDEYNNGGLCAPHRG